MSQFDVRIRETLEKTVSVDAKSMTEAQEIVEQGYKNSDYILDASDFKGVTIASLYPRYRDYER
jgi:hypothetical protein